MHKRSLIGPVLVVLLLLLPAVTIAQPAIVIDVDTHDFGIVHGKGHFEHRFEVKNGGTEDLIITKISPP